MVARKIGKKEEVMVGNVEKENKLDKNNTKKEMNFEEDWEDDSEEEVEWYA